MKKALVERNMAVVLFVLVLVVFSFAKRDTAKLFENNQVRNVPEISSPATPVMADVKASQNPLTGTIKN